MEYIKYLGDSYILYDRALLSSCHNEEILSLYTDSLVVQVNVKRGVCTTHLLFNISLRGTYKINADVTE